MKKFLFIISLMFIMFSFSGVYAAFNHIEVSTQNVAVDGAQKKFEVYNIDGNNYFKLRDIASVLNGTGSQFSVNFNSEKNLIEVSKGKAYNSVGGEMVVGADKSASAKESPQKIMIDNESKELKAFNIGDNNFFKLRDLGTELNFGVDFDSANSRVLITSVKATEVSNITNVVAKIYEGTMYVEIDTDKPVSDYSLFTLTDPNRIIIDIPNSNNKVDKKEVDVNYNGLTKVRMGDQGNSINRIVLDTEKVFDYKIEQSEDKKTLYLALSSSFVLKNALSEPDKNLYVYNGSIIGLPEENKSGEENNDTPVLTGNEAKISSITYTASTNKLKISADKEITYSASTMKNPYRIIVDIQDAVLSIDGDKTITPNNKNVKSINFSQDGVNKVKVVIELKKELEYSISEKSKSLEVILKEIVTEDLVYKKLSNSATITLYNVDEDMFSVVESISSNKYTLKYDTSDFNPKTETRKINDSWVKSIEITEGKIIIKGQEETTFNMEQDGKNVVITVEQTGSTNNTTNNKDGNFVVLLDAGHGGTDPGACNGDDYEKVYNLGIMLKLMNLLENTDGITVYASRTTDVFIDRQGRLDFATSHPEADLYVSIHNNSSTNKKSKGTLVLYHDNPYEKDYGITSKEFAQIVSQELHNDLQTQNWGVADNGEQIWVLYYSKLPSILCEVSFISNDEELAKLKTEEYQETAARAIYNGILKAKQQMGK